MDITLNRVKIKFSVEFWYRFRVRLDVRISAKLRLGLKSVCLWVRIGFEIRIWFGSIILV